ncbi:DUF1848 domain-containing protein [Pseudomonas sp. BW7P1]|uniref:DUF1848 domain-containing protein n=1 Tax=Pseudomonas TaxID=286 RepID=UPI0021AD7D8D|nr:DUF1848 domain-containing protein [Pseudomonas sp. BW7P1]UWI60119.1 DUF1848 domain-containing protein [Pseudomonas sp. BW7P1]
MIISASRRTDIPAFYADWFANRIREGFLLARNPFNAKQISRVSLLEKDVDVIVFWTRNASRLMRYLSDFDNRGLKYYFQYTITGYPRNLEKAVPKPYDAVRQFVQLSDMVGANKVVWRYDPILLSNMVPIDEHKRLFLKLAQLLEGKTKRVVISFSDFYKKTEKNLSQVNGLIYSDIVQQGELLLDLAKYMADAALQHGMAIQSCAEHVDTSLVGVPHGKCIDDKLIEELFGIVMSAKKDAGQREACGCIKSIDIGMYNTCLHECSYCYATFSKDLVVANKRKHDPYSPFLIGGVEGVDEKLLFEVQQSLF